MKFTYNYIIIIGWDVLWNNECWLKYQRNPFYKVNGKMRMTIFIDNQPFLSIYSSGVKFGCCELGSLAWTGSIIQCNDLALNASRFQYKEIYLAFIPVSRTLVTNPIWLLKSKLSPWEEKISFVEERHQRLPRLCI